MPVADFMALALGHPCHGYYMRGDPLGRSGDFITAPEISQVFGELIGLWSAVTWQQMGSPDRALLVANWSQFRHYRRRMQLAQTIRDELTFDEVVDLARDDVNAVDRLISSSLETDVLLVSQVAEYIVKSGGKRLRSETSCIRAPSR